MGKLKTYIAYVLALVFCSYMAGISLFTHTHISNGSSIIHSHLGGGSDHEHTDSEFAIIDILSDFQSESPTVFYGIDSALHILSESISVYVSHSYLNGYNTAFFLRGPPQA
ncbi:MAG: hypothetical protein J6A22_02050 [Bacteroidales bacterium]|nr:hypothetical protein [Bacteroidales bacterium]